MTDTSSSQQHLGSGFGAHSTATEVLDDVDLFGRTALVTGGHAGIGLEITRALHAAGATVLVPARRLDAASASLAGLERVVVGSMDLADLDSVTRYATSVVAEGLRLDMVIDNAGIMALPETRTAAGWELQLATNHLGHFALVNRLWPVVVDGARVVSVSSSGHQYSAMRWDDPWFKNGYDKWLAYGQSKTANSLFAVALDRRGGEHPDGRGIQAFSLHPGAILTNLGQHLTEADIALLMEPDEHGHVAIPDFKTPQQGAATACWAATSSLLDGRGGSYLEDCDVAPWAPDDLAPGQEGGGVRRWALDPADAERLWAWSAGLTGVDAFG